MLPFYYWRFGQSGERLQRKAPIRSLFHDEILNGSTYELSEVTDDIMDLIMRGTLNIDATEFQDAVTAGRCLFIQMFIHAFSYFAFAFIFQPWTSLKIILPM